MSTRHQIEAEVLVMGQNVVIEDDVVIRGKSNAKIARLEIGDNVFIGHGTRIFVDQLAIGDYTIIHNHGFIAGEKDVVIGGATKPMLQGMMGRAVADLRDVKLFPGAGHWVQQERPDETNAALIEFLTSLK